MIAPAAEALDAALSALALAGEALDRALRDAHFDPRELELVEERLFALRAAARKYGVPADALALLAEKFAGELAAHDAGEARLIQLTREGAAAEFRLSIGGACVVGGAQESRARARRRGDRRTRTPQARRGPF